MIKSEKPIISITAVRTGCGKSQVSRYVVKALQAMEKQIVSIRHPMPYGDLAKQAVQRFASIEDLDKHQCTIEEMEEYEPHIRNGLVIYSGVDYEAILKEAEKEAEIILWDGGNNDLPFYDSDVKIVLLDAMRPGHEMTYYPGYQNMISADIILVMKTNEAESMGEMGAVEEMVDRVKEHNPKALIIFGDSKVYINKEDINKITGKNVLVIEDGPSLTHGGLLYGAGSVAAFNNGASSPVDPRAWVTGKIKRTFERYPKIGKLLPAMGYDPEQIKDLENTIKAMYEDEAMETVVIGTPIDLSRIINFPVGLNVVNAHYDFGPRKGEPNLIKSIFEILEK